MKERSLTHSPGSPEGDSVRGTGLAWLHRYAILVAVFTLLLITAGGLVTSTGSGLSVPDWPLSYGKLFPPMRGGVLFEHGHRMIATTAGLLTIILAVWLWRREPRGWMRKLGVAALGAVVAQGLLGGLTVIFLLPTSVSVAHACLGQIFFGLVVAIAVLTGPAWRQPPPAAAATDPGRVGLAWLAGITTGVVFIQLLLGALMRHTASGLAIPDFPLVFGGLVPPVFDEQIAIHYAHRLGALAVAVMIVVTGVTALRRHHAQPVLAGPAILLLGLLPIQVLLGGMTVLSGKAVMPATAHVVVGALVLAVSLVLTLRAARLRRGAPAAQHAAGAAPAGPAGMSHAISGRVGS